MAAASAGTLEEDLTVLWTLLCAFFVFFMQSGFALLESGSIRNKNVGHDCTAVRACPAQGAVAPHTARTTSGHC